MARKGQKLTRSNTTTLNLDIDTSGITKMKYVAERARRRTIKYGWLNRRKHKYAKLNGQRIYVAQLAFWIEYGTKKQPPRPAFAQTIGRLKRNTHHLFAQYFKNTLKNGVVDVQTCEEIGIFANRTFDAVMKTQAFAPLKPSTIQRKGHNLILVEDAYYWQNFTHEVVKKNIHLIRG